MNKSKDQIFSFQKFYKLCTAITQYEDLDLLITHISKEICHDFMVKACCIMVFDDRENQLFRVSSSGLSDEYISKGPVFVKNDYENKNDDSPILIENMETDPRIQYPEAAKLEKINSLLIIPVKSRNSIIGEIRIYDEKKISVVQEDINTLCIIGQILGLIIENQGLKNFLDEVRIAIHNLPLRMLN